MTRIYTTGGNSKPFLRSTEVSDSIVQEMTDKYKDINTDSVDVIIEKELDPLRKSHEPLYVRTTESSVMIGYKSHDGWISVLTYNRNKEKWHPDIIEEPYYFDSALKYADMSHIHDYNTQKEFAREEFIKDDGLKWFKSNKSHSF